MSYIPHTAEEIKEMLSTIGAASVEDLFSSIPKELRSNPKLNLPGGLPESEVTRNLTDIALKNRTMSCAASFLGAGAYRHYIPAAVTELASRSEFVTPYTPYQPEISQGTLEALFEYQTEVSRLFEMDVSNASHYSGGTALADAALMARRVGKGRKKIIAPDNIHPEYREILSTYLCGTGDLVTLPTTDGIIDRASLKNALGPDTAAVVAQFPNFFGIVEDLKDIAGLTHNAGALFITVTPEPIAFGILATPGTFGTDIAVGEGLSLGLPVSFGGPTLGIFTVKKELVRQMPGRVCGRTTDAEGKTGYVLTLSTREQHIRREKATSNICSNQALCATTAAIYMALLGKGGMREVAEINAALCEYARIKFSKLNGISVAFRAPTFNEFVIRTAKPANTILSELAKRHILGGVDLGKWYPNMEDCILVCVTEMNTREEIDKYVDTICKII